MAKITQPQKTKFFCGLLSKAEFQISDLAPKLEKIWGPIERIYGPLPFNFTEYYHPEMGAPLLRRFVSFSHLFDRAELAERKLNAMRIEEEFLKGPGRRANLDPGYMTLGQLILSTSKDREHRIFIGKGVFAEVTLFYSKGSYQAFPWTYRDYASESYREIFLDIRNSLRAQLMAEKASWPGAPNGSSHTES